MDGNKLESKFKIGDNVIPISKSIGSDLNGYGAWNDSKSRGFMYICEVSPEIRLNHKPFNEVVYTCNTTEDETGDYFFESDLVPYLEVKSEFTMEDILNLLNETESKFEPIFLSYDFTIKSDVNLAKFKGLVQKLKDIVENNSN